MDETEEEIANQLQELQTLMATLDISEKNKNIEEDGYKFVYDFDSDSSVESFDENPQVGFVKTDNAETSEQGRKRGRREGKEERIDAKKVSMQRKNYKTH